jgi:hypothetical protein
MDNISSYPTIGPLGRNDSLRYIRLQNLYVHADQLGKLISRYNRPIVIETELNDFPFYFRGSACLLKLQNRFFAVTCFHNLTDVPSPFEGIFLQARLGGGVHSNIPLSGVFTPKKELRGTADCLDVAFFEVDLSSLQSDRLDCEFFEISKGSDCYVPVSNEPILACGFPYCNGTADCQNQAIGRPAVIVDGRFENWSNEPHLFYCKIQKNPAGGVSDGFSGGGAFGMRPKGPMDIEVCFSGIVVRGGDDFFYAIKSDFIRSSLSKLINNS